MANSKYYNATYRVPSGGGAVRVALSNNLGQGNGGTSLPCTRVKLVTDQTDGSVRVNVGAAASNTLGMPVPWFLAGAEEPEPPIAMEIDIDDVSKLYFYGSSGNIDILWRN